MKTLSYKTEHAKKEAVQPNWLLIDAENQTLGRLASMVAFLLRGKHKAIYTPNVDCGDHVVIINAEKIHLTGKKWDQKEYIHYTGYPGGQRIATAKEVLAKKPVALIEDAVKGMLPKTRLGRAMFRKLHVYTGPEHPHEAQQPKKIELKEIKQKYIK